MMKTVRILGLVAAVVMLAAPYARADRVVLKADIPFAFMVADRQLPSGEYRFVQGDYAGVVEIYSKQQKHLATALCQPVLAGGDRRVELVFHRHGEQRFLKMIRRQAGSGFYFPKTRSETLAEAGGATAITGMQ